MFVLDGLGRTDELIMTCLTGAESLKSDFAVQLKSFKCHLAALNTSALI